MNVFDPTAVQSIAVFARPGPFHPSAVQIDLKLARPGLFENSSSGTAETIIEYVDREVFVEVPVTDAAREAEISRNVAELTAVAVLTASAHTRGRRSVINLAK